MMKGLKCFPTVQAAGRKSTVCLLALSCLTTSPWAHAAQNAAEAVDFTITARLLRH